MVSSRSRPQQEWQISPFTGQVRRGLRVVQMVQGAVGTVLLCYQRRPSILRYFQIFDTWLFV
jgi:hypothetical protein